MIGTNTALQGKKKYSTARRDTTRARSRPLSAESGEPSNVRHNEHTARRKVDLISKNVVCGSQSGLEMTCGGLTGTSANIVCRFIRHFYGIAAIAKNSMSHTRWYCLLSFLFHVLVSGAIYCQLCPSMTVAGHITLG